MSIEKVNMPNLGESVTEATIVNWLVKPGDNIKKYDPLAEVVSDKVTTEIPSSFDGKVKDLLVQLDETVAIGTPIMSIEVAGEQTSAEKSSDSSSHVTLHEADMPATTNTASLPNKTLGRVSPAVISLAQEKNIDLNQVTGTGAGGRITRKDVINFEPNTLTSTPAASEGAPVEAVKQSAPVLTTPTVYEIKSAPLKPSSAELLTTRVPADPIRKAIAAKMQQSATEIPHAWVMIEADVSNIVQLRQSVKSAFEQREGIKLSYFPFFMQAVVKALKSNPLVNSSWDNGTIVYHNAVNLSIAVTTDKHLYVPVIKNAENYSLTGLAKELNRLAKGVREETLTAQEMQDGTFTINNTGTLGSVQSMGIINYPQAAILQVESIKKRVVAVGENGFKTADIVNLCLSIDHRLLDGQQAGKFLQDIKDNLAHFKTEADI